MSDAFGGSKSKQTQTSSSTSQGTSDSVSASVPVDLTPEAFAGLQDPLANALKTLFGNGGTSGIPSYSGSTSIDPSVFSAPETANEQELRAALMGDARSGTRPDYLSDVISGKYLASGTGMNPFLDALSTAANRSTMDQLTEAVGRQIPSLFATAGQVLNPHAPNINQTGSSAFDRAAALAYRGAANAIADTNAKIYGGAYESERGRQQEAIPLSQQEVQTTVSNLQAQALPRLIQQYGLDQGMEEFKTRINALLSALQIAAGVTQPTVSQASIGSSSAQQTAESQGKATGTSETKPNIVQTIASPFSFGITR